MTKPLNPTVHGIIDYAAAAFLLAAPSIFGFMGTAATLLYVVGTAHVLLSLMTAYPLGLFKAIPFTVHAWIELSAAIFLAASPWIFGFASLEIARNVYVASGLSVVAVWTLTNYTNSYKTGTGSAEKFTEFHTDRERKVRRAA